MRQRTFSSGFEKHSKRTRKERFLSEMDDVVPWKALMKELEPYYPDPQEAGRRPKGLERMLRIYFMQHWYNLSDSAMEEALYDSMAMRGERSEGGRSRGVDLGEERVPDESTILQFRHLMEEAREFGAELLRLVNVHLAEQGLTVSRGTIMDATIVNAPPSTKNRDKARDPEMHQTKKGNQWHFGLKAHIGVGSQTKQVHSVAVTAANVHDSQVLGDLLHGDETRVWGFHSASCPCQYKRPSCDGLLFNASHLDCMPYGAGCVTVVASRLTAVCANSLPSIDARLPNVIDV